MSPMTTLFWAAFAAPAASHAQSAPASVRLRLDDFMQVPPAIFECELAFRRHSAHSPMTQCMSEGLTAEQAGRCTLAGRRPTLTQGHGRRPAPTPRFTKA